jgi:hypothetical protein
MTTSAKSFHPPWATLTWADDRYIYTEIPSAAGPPFIQRYTLSEGGLSKALSFLRDHHARAKAATKTAPTRRWAETQVQGKPRPGTPEQRGKARDLIRRLKVV